MDSGSRTVGNSPASSPGLFSPATPPLAQVQQPDDGFYSSPWLHHTHRQAPKETHRADVDVDPISGRKIINQYEVMDELGRGVHGKVKLGRNLETGLTVAIKIVDRYSKRRRLNKDTSREDKIKREIAILKKARHPNIVSLLEVIDDPTRKKVYIVLEHVELGEVRWRTEGEREICLIEWRRYQRESQGALQNESAKMEDDKIIALAHQKLERQQRQRARMMHKLRLGQSENQPWSLEHGGESDEEYCGSGRTSRASTQSGDHVPNGRQIAEQWARSTPHEVNMETAVRSTIPTSAPMAPTGLEGTMYGAYDNDSVRGRTPSVAESGSSRFTDEGDEVPEHFRYVPLLTLQTALETFRDTLLGLEFLHYQGVVHRDIKPANLLQTREHRIKISDFGVSYLGRARLESDDCDQSESDMQDAEAIELAKTVGTPAFYAPELCRIDDEGDAFPVTKQIDIWALGVTLYCLIYGRVPFHDHNTFSLMKTIVEEDVFIPKFRLKAVADQSGSRPSSHGRMFNSIPNDKRAPHDLEYEEVDDTLRDLLKRLLTKDPRRRITIQEIKHHPWVLQGLDNNLAWVEETDPGRTTQGKRIEVSNEDMEKAVVPVTFVDRVRSGVRKILDIGMGRRGASRKRAQSTATSPDQTLSISARSSSSTVSQEGRRGSLGINQTIFEALTRNRESDHPLSHSVSASPEARERASFFESKSRTASPAYSTESNEHLAPLAGSSRPPPLERAHSAMSSAASVRTVRPGDSSPSARNPTMQDVVPQGLPGTPTTLDTPSGSGLGGIFGGVPRLMSNMRSRERLSKLSKRPLEHTRAKTEWVGDTYDDPHSGPSIALSNASAVGHVDQPDILKDPAPGSARSPWPTVSSLNSPDPVERAASRQSSISSASSYLHRAYGSQHQTMAPSHGTEHYIHQEHQGETSDERYNRAKGDLIRQRVAEEKENRSRSASDAPRPPSRATQAACPPSPDDMAIFEQHHQKVEDYLNHKHLPSLDTSPTDYLGQTKGLVSSSSEDYFGTISQSTSDPSIPSAVSATSSVGPDDCFKTVLSIHPPTSVSATPSKESSSDQLAENSEDPAGYDGDGDHALESEDDDSDGGFIVMAGRKKAAHLPAHSGSISNAELARSDIRKSYASERRRSARSGSNGTVKKIKIPGASDQKKEGS
jgi:[calcium/calmodulin-dependent protein kinase] kinase